MARLIQVRVGNPFPSLPIVLERQKNNEEPANVEFNINLRNKVNTGLTSGNKIYIQNNIEDLQNIFKIMIKIFCNLKKNNRSKINIIAEIRNNLRNNNLFKNLYVGDPNIKPNLIVFSDNLLGKFIDQLSNKPNITNLCKLTHAVKVLVGGGNIYDTDTDTNIDINLMKILSDKYDIELLDKNSKYYNYNVDWMNSRKEFQNLVYNMLNTKTPEIFFNLISKSMTLLDSVVLSNDKYCTYKHLYNIYQDKKMKNLI